MIFVRTPKACNNLCHPFRVRFHVATHDPGCASRPWAVELHAVGVNMEQGIFCKPVIANCGPAGLQSKQCATIISGVFACGGSPWVIMLRKRWASQHDW